MTDTQVKEPFAVSTEATYELKGELVNAFQRNEYVFRCPNGHIVVKKKAEFALGLHQIICVQCGHTTNRAIDDQGFIHEVGAEAAQGGGA